MATRCPSCQTDNPDTAKFCNNCATSLHETPARDLPPGATQTMESRYQELTTGTEFGGRYQIIEQLGRGGMGRVYRAVDVKTREEVALKIIRPDIASDKRTLDRFVNEIKLAHKVSHRNIGRMYHLGEDRGIHYITMEYVPGEDLKSFIRRSRRLDVGTTVAIAKQVCAGLSEAHEAGIVHRDLKPGNIMIDQDGNAKILDFGIARALGGQGLTEEGSVIGTPDYMSPEQVEGREADSRSDIYSFGVIIFEMVTGRTPFAADTPFVVAFKQQSERPPRPEDLNPQTPPELAGVILKCLEKDREKRYQTTHEICRDLDKIEETLQTTPATAARRRPTTRKTRPAGAGAAIPWRKAAVFAAALLGLLAVGVIIRGFIPAAKGAARTVAVIGFENVTGESAYEYLRKAIPNLLITSLEQSKYLEVMSWERVNELAQNVTGQELDAWYGICRREGIETVVLGRFYKANNLFATEARIYDVQTRKLLKSVSSKGDGVDSILRTQIDEMSREISKGAGLSERAASRHALPISQVTTASMPAYESFLKGREQFDRYYYEEARQSLEQAVKQDPEFALPYYYLMHVYSALADEPRAGEALEKFKQYRRMNPANGRDGLYAAALSALIEKDKEGYVKGLQEVIRAYPDDKRAHVDLAWFYKNGKKYDEAIGEFEKALKIDPKFGYALNLLAYTYTEMDKKDLALQTFERYAAVQPGDANPYDSMGDMYFLTGKFDLARAKYEQALAVRPEFASSWKLAYLHAMGGDYDAALKWIDHLLAHAPTDGLKSQGHQWKGFYYHIMGRLESALAEFEQAETLAKAGGNADLADLSLRGALWATYDWGKYDLCRTYLEKRMVYRKESGRGTPTLNRIYEDLYAGLLDVQKGGLAAARKRLDDIKTLSSSIGEKEKLFKEIAVNSLERQILFAEGRYDEAIEMFKQAPPVQINLNSYMSVQQRNLPFEADLPARAFLKKGDLDKAVAEYERLVSSDPHVRESTLIHPFSHFRLAALYEARGQKAKAAEHYAKAFQVWRNADADLPEIAAARKHLKVLKSDAASTAKPKTPVSVGQLVF